MFWQLFNFRTSTGDKKFRFGCVDNKSVNIEPVGYRSQTNIKLFSGCIQGISKTRNCCVISIHVKAGVSDCR